MKHRSPSSSRAIGALGRRVRGVLAGGAWCLAAAVATFVSVPAASVLAAPDVAGLVDEANRRVRQHDTANALKLLEQAIALDPASVEAHVRYQDIARDSVGLAALQARYAAEAKARPADAIAQFLSARLLPAAAAAAEFEKQTKQFDASPWAFAGLARAREDTGKLAEAALAYADGLTRAGANTTRFLAYRAYGFERTGQWDLAAASWKSVLEKAPKDLAAHMGLAESLRRAGHLDDALAAVDAAQKLGLSDSEVHYRRGMIEFDADRWDKALAAFDAALKIDEKMVEAYGAASEAALRRAFEVAAAEGRAVGSRDFDRAAGYGERGVVRVPESAYVHYVLGAALEAQGAFDQERLDSALMEYDAALERIPIPGPEKVRVLTARAWVLNLKGNWDAAVDAAQRALDIDRNCVIAYAHAGYAVAAQGKQRDAIEKWYRRGLQVDPGNARLQHDMGVALWEMGKPNDAKKPLEDARTSDPKNGRFRLTLGELYYHLKRNKDAVAELRLATDLAPFERQAWRSLGRAAYSAKDWPECVRAYEKFVSLDDEAVDEHLVLAVVYSEQLKDRVRARASALRFRQKGGDDANLASWLAELLGEAPAEPANPGGK